MLNKLTTIGNSAWYWLALIALGFSMEAIALIYQYMLDYYPCVLCIHVRIWVLGIILTALLGLLVRRVRGLRLTAHVLMTGMMAGLLERSWMLLGIERGTVEGSCDFDSGLPAWFALDQWFPAMFKVWEACGYTPELLLGITMAEGLVVLSAALLLISAVLTIADYQRRTRPVST
jgi:disulfide bond formation protein DsbB